MRHVRLLALTTLLAGSILAKPAAANPCGFGDPVWMTPIFVTTVSLQANTTYTFETTNLLPLNPSFSADTVMHVQDVNGNYITGNDDYNGTLASHVVYTPTTAQTVKVIVRAYTSNNAGTATFNVWNGVVRQSTYAITFAGQSMDVSATGMVAGTDIMTTERFDGPRDSVILVNSGGASRAIAFDDDSGLDLQSWLHLTSACPVGDCKIIFGRYFDSYTPDGWGILRYDGDVHNGLDPDGDGLGNCVETYYGTNPNLPDTDGDGLSDSAELIGVDSTTSWPVKLATWGANPLKKDLFLEMDWMSCDVATDPSCNGNPDFYQMTGADAASVASYFAPDISVHLDIGVINPATTKDQWAQWGNWWGATRTSPFTGACDTLTPSRVGLFHHFHITAPASSGGGQTIGDPSTCSYGSSHRRTVAHELGHQIGLFHEGNTGTGKLNSKPNYPSMINYGYSYDDSVSFSRNTQPSLSPATLAETNSPLSSQVLTSLASGSWVLRTDPANREVDWNRDGQYDTQVRGAPTWIWNSLAPETTEAWHDFGMTDRHAPTFARSASPSRFYMFSTSQDFKMQYRYTTGFSACTGGDASSPCVTWSGPTTISNAVAVSATSGVSAAYRVTVGTEEKMMLVYTDPTGILRYQLGDSTGTWSAPKLITSTASDFKVGLAPSGASGRLRLYYKNTNSNRLNSVDYDPTRDLWPALTAELDDAGNTIPVNLGVSIIQGKEPGKSAAWYMALANASNAIELWRYNSTTSRWTKLPNIWVTTQPTASAGPSLAYVPFSTSDTTKGQFYLSYHEAGGWNSAYIMKTEGNDTSTSATSRRFQFREPGMFFYNYWGTAQGSPAIFYEMGVDTNLRGAFPTVDTSSGYYHISFFPAADGIANITLKDQDDYYYMTNTLACSLGHGGCISL